MNESVDVWNSGLSKCVSTFAVASLGSHLFYRKSWVYNRLSKTSCETCSTHKSTQKIKSFSNMDSLSMCYHSGLKHTISDSWSVFLNTFVKKNTEICLPTWSQDFMIRGIVYGLKPVRCRAPNLRRRAPNSYMYVYEHVYIWTCIHIYTVYIYVYIYVYDLQHRNVDIHF